MKFRYILLGIAIIGIGTSYYIGNSIMKIPNKLNINNIVKTSEDNIKHISHYEYTSQDLNEIANAKSLISKGILTGQKNVTVSSSMLVDKGITIPVNTYIYKINGAFLGLSNQIFNFYSVFGVGTFKDKNQEYLQKCPSEFNIKFINTGATSFNIIGAINGYYYVEYMENGSSNKYYAFIKSTNIKVIKGLYSTDYSYRDNLKVSELVNLNDYKYSGLNIYSNPYLFDTPISIINFKALNNFKPIVIGTKYDATEIYYNGTVGWIRSGSLEDLST